jgi:hypothetical protein
LGRLIVTLYRKSKACTSRPGVPPEVATHAVPLLWVLPSETNGSISGYR